MATGAVTATVALGLPAASVGDAAGTDVSGVGLFVAESGRATALEGARFAAGQGIPVLVFEPTRPAEFAAGLRLVWARGPARIVGLSSRAAYAVAQDVAAEFGFAISRHAAAADAERLHHWTVAPATT